MRIDRKFLLLLAGSLALGACDGGGPAAGGSPRLGIQLHDAPGDLAEAWVKVDRIYLQGRSATDSTSGRQDLLTTQTGWIDLLTLSGGNAATLVSNATVPAGTYSQLRFVVCQAYVKTKTGTVYATSGAALPAGVTATGTLQAPSLCTSGLKVKLPGGAVQLADGSKILSVDFDVSQSFGHQAGSSGKWVLHPVLQATDLGLSGGISGTVALAAGVALPACGGGTTDLARFVPLAIAGADSLSGSTQASGAYSIANVTPGTYTMSYAPALSYTNGDSLMITAAPSVPTVTVASGSAAAANYTIQAATCKPHA